MAEGDTILREARRIDRALAGAPARELGDALLDEGRATFGVYRRARRPCARCGTPIEARGQGDANRRTYWCPSCQQGA